MLPAQINKHLYLEASVFSPTGHFKSSLNYQYEKKEQLMRTDVFLVAHPHNRANYAIFTQVGVQALILHIMVECSAVKENAPALF